jgi:hypothetical protein
MPATANEPKLQPPMEAANPAPRSSEPGAKAVVTTQPVSSNEQHSQIIFVARELSSVKRKALTFHTQASEPRPTMESDMALRGGGLTHYCGFSCCDGRCNFRLC